LVIIFFLVYNHIVDDKIYAHSCLFVVILNGWGMRVCYDCDGCASLLTFHSNFTAWCLILFSSFVPPNLKLTIFQVAISLLRSKYFNVHCLESLISSHTRNESLDFISLTLEFLCLITIVTKAILLIHMSPTTLCAFLYVLGLQDITGRLNTILCNLDGWGIFYCVHSWRGYIHLMVLQAYEVYTISWYLSHVGHLRKSTVDLWDIKHLNLWGIKHVIHLRFIFVL
jgi:hypothetical protein